MQHTYPLEAAIKAATAVLPHANTDTMSPPIMSAWLTPTHWYATDRYTVGRYELAGDPDTFIVLPLDALKWVATIKPGTLRHVNRATIIEPAYQLRVTHPPHENGKKPSPVLVEVLFNNEVERAQAFDPVSGTYPPVDRLFDTWKAASENGRFPDTIRLAPAHLEKVTTWAKRNHKEEPVIFELGTTEHGDKPSPTRATIGLLSALIQPNLNLRKHS